MGRFFNILVTICVIYLCTCYVSGDVPVNSNGPVPEGEPNLTNDQKKLKTDATQTDKNKTSEAIATQPPDDSISFWRWVPLILFVPFSITFLTIVCTN